MSTKGAEHPSTASMEWALVEIKKLQIAAHSGNPPIKPHWPVLVLRMLKGLGDPAYVRLPRARLGHTTHLEQRGRRQSRPPQTHPQSSVPDERALESTPGSPASYLPHAHAVILRLFAHLVSSKVVNAQLVGSSDSTHRM
ncbi:hypothetical protein B0H10DRAFT_2235459 [Mycena sp. CBHHK59/15]|nr:hypothetical protein B0H10DRAFT_2235459 [Mycena sp. CBHHK59/15]